MDDLAGMLFLAAAVGWLVLQIAAIRTMQGRWQKAAWLSVAVMLLAIAIAAFGVLAGSNIAPIWIALALPVCLVWIVGLWIMRLLTWLSER